VSGVQVFTLVAAGFCSGLLFALAVYTPGCLETNDLVDLRTASLSNTNSTLGTLGTYAAAQNPVNDQLNAQLAAEKQQFKALGDPSKSWISNQGIINSMTDVNQLANAQLKP
jgi:hypothetical protein